MNLLEQFAGGLGAVRACKPIVHHITNYVSINDCANITLAIGASPIMANDPAEVAEVVSQSAALALSLELPNTRMLESMLVAGRQANAKGIPVVLDAGAVDLSKARIRAAEQLLLMVRLSAVRGSLAEIRRLAEIYASMQGLDLVATEEIGGELVRQAANHLGCLVAATGETDYISDGREICRIDSREALLSRIQGVGCMTTSLMAACCGALGSSLPAAASGVLYMGIAGAKARIAMREGDGLGIFRLRLIDAVGNLESGDVLTAYAK